MRRSLNVRPAVTMSELAVDQVITKSTRMNRLARQNAAYAEKYAEAARELAGQAVTICNVRQGLPGTSLEWWRKSSERCAVPW